MKKFINKAENMLVESLRGFEQAHKDIVRLSLDPIYVARVDAPVKNKVNLISGGGSGHEPMHAGFVGKGMLDGACPGEVFTSPTPDQMLAAAQAVHGGQGVLFIIKNYAGDVMNFEMAADMFDGKVAQIITHDDVAVESSLHSQGRRGVAATIILEKIVGAAAETGADLDRCHKLAQKVNDASGSMGVGLTSCTVPAAGKPTFAIGDDEMEVGIGIHGEPGIRRAKLMQANDLVHEMVKRICDDIQPKSGQDVILMVNGMGGTPLLELYLIYHAVQRECAARKINIVRSLVGNYCTSLEMAGCSITLTQADQEILKLWDAPVHTAALRR